MNSTQSKFVTAREMTVTPFLAQHDPAPRNDYLVRVITGLDETTSARAFVKSTADVQAQLLKWASNVVADVDCLRHVVQWQHKVIDYNSVYQAFLMDQLTDDEFEAEAGKFAYEPDSVDSQQLALKVQRIYALTGIPYTPSEISGLFQCNHEDAIRAIALVRESHPELGYMLPEDQQ